MPKKGENIRRRKDGRWEARFIRGYNEEGKAVYASLYGKSYAEVKDKRLMEMQKYYNSRDYFMNNKDSTTVNDILTEWLGKQKHMVKQSTYAHYISLADRHIRPMLGEVKTRFLNQAMIDSFTENKLTMGRLDNCGGLSSKTVSDLLSVIRLVISYAEEKGLITKGYITIRIPRSQQTELRILSKSEQSKLETYIRSYDDQIQFGILLCLYTGLRIGELCALKWSDISVNCDTIYIRRTIMRIKDTLYSSSNRTKVVFDTPKTKSSMREIPVPLFLREYFLKYKDSFPLDSYFLTGCYEYIEPRAYQYKYKNCLKNSGISDYTFHTLRHTFATRCIEKGFDAKTLSEILGHASVNITLQRYVHSSMELKRMYMDRLTVDF